MIQDTEQRKVENGSVVGWERRVGRWKIRLLPDMKFCFEKEKKISCLKCVGLRQIIPADTY